MQTSQWSAWRQSMDVKARPGYTPVAIEMARFQSPLGVSDLHRIGILLVGVIFLFSGAFALVYEVTWARMLTPQFGSDAVAIAIVVSVFMLGLGVGAWLAGLWGDSFRNPLRTYGLLEMLLGVYVLVSPWMIGWFAPALTLLGHGAIENPWILNSARTLLGLIVLLPPTLIMGASLPLLARFAADVARHVPTAVIGLYAINIVGAVIGVLAAGYWLLPAMGMKSVLWLIGTANLAMGLVVVLISRSFVDVYKSRRSQSVGDMSDPAESIGLGLPLAVALVGLASMACQLAWTRVIVLIVGGSVYAFSSVLAVFLAGLGLGAWLAALAVRLSGRHTLLLFSIAGAVSVVSILSAPQSCPCCRAFSWNSSMPTWPRPDLESSMPRYWWPPCCFCCRPPAWACCSP
jgi:spermidine synthase